MFFEFRHRNRTIKDLRKDHGLTVQQLADRSAVDKLEIIRIDHLRLKEIKDPTRSKLLHILRGDYMDSVNR